VGEARGQEKKRNKGRNRGEVSGYYNVNPMSNGLREETQGEKVELRRSARNKKVGAIEKLSRNKGGLERIGPGAEDTLSVDGSECSTETIIVDPRVEYVFRGGVYVVAKREEDKVIDSQGGKVMASDHDVVEGPPGSTFSVDSGRGSTLDSGMGEFMRGYFEEQRRRDERREEQMQRERAETRAREERERAEARAREDRMWAAMSRAAPTPEPEPRHKPILPLPVMKEKDEVTEFLPKFEAALSWGKVPRDQWRELLVSHIHIDLLMRVKCQLDDEASTYDDIVGALSNSSTLTFGAAAEDLCTGERGRIWEQEGRKAAAKIKGLLGQVTKEADDKREILECLTVVLLRDKLVPSLKSYVDSGRRFGEEWERVQPNQTSWFKKRTTPSVSNRTLGNSGQNMGRKPVTCYSCGKRSAGPVLLWWRQ